MAGGAAFYFWGLVVVAVGGRHRALVGGAGLAVVAGVVALALVVLVGLVKRLATRYVITSERLHIRRGILAKKTQETRIQRVQNVNTEQSFLQRILRVGTVDFDTAGTDDSEFRFVGVATPTRSCGAVDRAQRREPPGRARPIASALPRRDARCQALDSRWRISSWTRWRSRRARCTGSPARCAAAISRSSRFLSSCSRSSASASGSAARSPARITSSATAARARRRRPAAPGRDARGARRGSARRGA